MEGQLQNTLILIPRDSHAKVGNKIPLNCECLLHTETPLGCDVNRIPNHYKILTSYVFKHVIQILLLYELGAKPKMAIQF